MALDFDSTKGFRDRLISRTLLRPNGPQTFTNTNYRVQNLSDISNIDQPDVDATRLSDLSIPQRQNIFKPEEYFIVENLNTLPRRANLNLYPYFTTNTNRNLIGIYTTDNFEFESEMIKFANRYIKEDENGPINARTRQNLAAATVGRVRIIDALNGNLATATNIVTGREPLVELNYKITAAQGLIGKGIDFLQTVSGIEFPWSEVPGDYLTNPAHISQNASITNPDDRLVPTIFGIFGKNRRKQLDDLKPSDIFIDYMGEGQRQILYDQLSYSKYAPNYSSVTRRQTGTIKNALDNGVQSIRNSFGLDAPLTDAYIGDDRHNSVSNAMNDLSGVPVKSSYYLSIFFDPELAVAFKKDRNLINGGGFGGNLTWISKNNVVEFGDGETEVSQENNFSTKYGFKEGSILYQTQQILDNMPQGGESLSHVGAVINQTTKMFKEGDIFFSKGSAVQPVDSYNRDTPSVFCRVWAKDKGYLRFENTMRTTGLIRKYDDSVLSTPWNLNITPVSNGNKQFDSSSTNMAQRGDGFYAKKYMFSIENLAWKTSNTNGFTVNDLPYCERGPNGGRIMWFPPYDLKVSENNSANWEATKLIGRTEPIYTYQNAERTGQLSFKIIVDHPSILNLLVREHFKNMSDDEADNYIDAFFSGCEELDFYDLIKRYTTLSADDVKMIQAYLNNNVDQEQIKTYVSETNTLEQTLPSPPPESKPEKQIENPQVKQSFTLYFDNAIPTSGKTETSTNSVYEGLVAPYNSTLTTYGSQLSQKATLLLTTQINDNTYDNDRIYLFGSKIPSGTTSELVSKVTNQLNINYSTFSSEFTNFKSTLSTLKDYLKNNVTKEIKFVISSSCSAAASDDYNIRLSIRRAHSIIQDIFAKIKNDKIPDLKWPSKLADLNPVRGQSVKFTREFNFKDFGWNSDGKIIFDIINYGENYDSLIKDKKCTELNFKTIELRKAAPAAFSCRQTEVELSYVTYKKLPENKNVQQEVKTQISQTTLKPNGNVTVKGKGKKPMTDPMKKIIMKTLSECYYFQKLEETSPIVYKSLRDKLKYFHPAFHSMTPEGLNSRLTFLLQCLRPGDTIPIKGIGEDSDLNARNTSFGPPPICVMRIGDFFHSKIIIRDVNIRYEESTWDLNPEGIGIQPMIADVTLSVSFIGGHGLKEPVSRLQNALSSNFYANTEIYDERSISTAEKINNEEADKFTKDFLEELMYNYNKQNSDDNINSTLNEGQENNVSNGVFVGTPVII